MLRLSQETIAVIGATVALATFVAYLSFTSRDQIHQRFETLEGHVDQRFDSVDQRFDTVDQRFETLEQHMNHRFDAVDQRFDAGDQRITDLERHMNQRFDAVDQRFEGIESRFNGTDRQLEILGNRITSLTPTLLSQAERISRLEALREMDGQLPAGPGPAPAPGTAGTDAAPPGEAE